MTKTEIIEKYYNKIYNICLYNTFYNQADAEDCTQEIFIALILKYDKIADDRIYNWLLKTTYYKLKNYHRKIKTKSKTILSDDINITADDKADICDLIISDEEIETYKQNILNELSEKERELYRDYFENDLSYKEISEKLNIKYSTAQMRVSALKKKLQKRAMETLCIGGASMLTLRLLLALLGEK